MHSGYRWLVALLLATATALNYLDRQSLPVVIAELQKQIAISPEQYARIQAAFLLAYAAMYAIGGRIIDYLGTKAGYAVFIAWWSAATVAHGLANSVGGLATARFLLGIGEGGGFPASAKAVAETFPPKERSFAFGLFNTGSSLGAVIAPPLISFVALSYGWRAVFYLAGAAGFAWLALWMLLFRSSAPEAPNSPRPSATPRESWLALLSRRETVGLVIAKFLSDAAWYFYIFWLPKYLNDARGLDTKAIGDYAWVPYAFAAAGSFFGGLASSWLLARTSDLNRSRKLVLGTSAAIMPVSLLISQAPLSSSLFFFGLAMLGHQCWSSLVQTVVADVFPPSSVATVSGLVGCAGSLGGLLFNLLIGWMITAFSSYSPVFTVSGLLHPLAFLVLVYFLPRIHPVEEVSP